MENSIEELVSAVSLQLKTKNWKVVTAESCTGGGLAFSMTNLPGSSAWFERGFITYSNDSKQEMLDVSSTILATVGAVSSETAKLMAEGALIHSRAQISVSITGIAGPDGGSIEKPVGTVWFGLACINQDTQTYVYHLKGNRQEIREQSIKIALNELLQMLLKIFSEGR